MIPFPATNQNRKDMDSKYTTLEAVRAIVESICGTDPLAPGRTRTQVASRTLLVNALLAQGRTEEETAQMIGYNRNTIHHYRDLLRDALTYAKCNPLLSAWWGQLKNVLGI